MLMTGFFDFVSYAAGLSGTRWRGFALPLLFSVLLSTAPIVALGAGIFEDGQKLLIGGVLGCSPWPWWRAWSSVAPATTTNQLLSPSSASLR